MNDLFLESYLTATATCVSLPRQDCVCCGHLLFKGYPLVVEIKCRSCKAMNVVTPESARFYHIQPY